MKHRVSILRIKIVLASRDYFARQEPEKSVGPWDYARDRILMVDDYAKTLTPERLKAAFDSLPRFSEPLAFTHTLTPEEQAAWNEIMRQRS